MGCNSTSFMLRRQKNKLSSTKNIKLTNLIKLVLKLYNCYKYSLLTLDYGLVTNLKNAVEKQLKYVKN